ncbi:MAG: DUF2809 domain-containing protein [Myxococcota bacterium]
MNLRAAAAALALLGGGLLLFTLGHGALRGLGSDVLVVVFGVACLAAVGIGSPRVRVAVLVALGLLAEGIQALHWVGPDSHWLLHLTLGSTADPLDAVAYGVGGALAAGAEWAWAAPPRPDRLGRWALVLVGAALLAELAAAPVLVARYRHDRQLRALARTLEAKLGGVEVSARVAGLYPPYSSNLCQLLAGAVVPAGVAAPAGVTRITPAERDPGCATCEPPGVAAALAAVGPDQALWYVAQATAAGADLRCR